MQHQTQQPDAAAKHNNQRGPRPARAPPNGWAQQPDTATAWPAPGPRPARRPDTAAGHSSRTQQPACTHARTHSADARAHARTRACIRAHTSVRPLKRVHCIFSRAQLRHTSAHYRTRDHMQSQRPIAETTTMTTPIVLKHSRDSRFIYSFVFTCTPRVDLRTFL